MVYGRGTREVPGNRIGSPHDYSHMRCTRFREAISARLDGEDPGLPTEQLDAHLAGCPDCRSWAGAASSPALRALAATEDPVASTRRSSPSSYRRPPRPSPPADG